TVSNDSSQPARIIHYANSTEPTSAYCAYDVNPRRASCYRRILLVGVHQIYHSQSKSLTQAARGMIICKVVSCESLDFHKGHGQRIANSNATVVLVVGARFKGHAS